MRRSTTVPTFPLAPVTTTRFSDFGVVGHADFGSVPLGGHVCAFIPAGSLGLVVHGNVCLEVRRSSSSRAATKSRLLSHIVPCLALSASARRSCGILLGIRFGVGESARCAFEMRTDEPLELLQLTRLSDQEVLGDGVDLADLRDRLAIVGDEAVVHEVECGKVRLCGVSGNRIVVPRPVLRDSTWGPSGDSPRAAMRSAASSA